MNTIPYRGVEVLRVIHPTPPGEGYRWQCGRCKRQGRLQAYAAAASGKERHEAYHRAQDAIAAKRVEAEHIAGLFNGEGD